MLTHLKTGAQKKTVLGPKIKAEKTLELDFYILHYIFFFYCLLIF